MSKVAFNTANLVGRVTNYHFELKNWGEQDRLTREKTNEKEWAAICGEIAAAGYRAVEIWVAHLNGPALSDASAKTYRKILDDNGLTPIGLAGTLNDETAGICKKMGIPACNGGLWGSDIATVLRLMKSTGLKYNYENHPEKSAEELVAKIDNGATGIGLAVDTGWLATQGMDCPAAIRKLGKLIAHVHLKDVKKAGAHETVPLGTGVADIPGIITALKGIGYRGWYSWEDEPEDRNPLKIAAEMRRWIEDRIKN